MQKRILCFGDSNTYGYIPTGGRYDEHTRWPMRMQDVLGMGYTIIEEGFNGRTCVFDDPVEGGFKSGIDYLPPCLMSHNPLDAVIIMLGTNDTKVRFGMTPMTIGQSMMQLVRTAKMYAINEAGETSHIIVVSPPKVLDNLMSTRHAECFGEQAIAVSAGLSRELRRITKLMRCDFFDAEPHSEVSQLDAVHMTERGHLLLGEAMAAKIKAELD
ncbi:MAG: SGNH/GDSL hydrolase family protein [Clostridia bacterium]|nr:SGNH/GDSL hydrolase family protein [Clostridia bacterium]